MDQEKNEKQLFIRNLSYQTTAEDLTNLFQTFGPLKHASVVQDAAGVSKGFGFVKFALEEDASSALEKLQGSSLHSRKIKLELGVKKERVSKKDREAAAASGEPIEKVVVKTEVKQPKEPKAVKAPKVKVESETVESKGEAEEGGDAVNIKKSRQILVFGVPTDISKKAFKMAISKISKKSEVELIKEENELSASLHIISPPGKIMLITAISRQEAAKIMTTLNNPTTTVHNLDIRKYMQQSDEPSTANNGNKKEKLVARTLADLTEIEYRKRKCRLILRNLSFQAVEQNVIDRMSKFGPLVSVEIPRTIIEKTNVNRHRKKANNAEENGDDAQSPDQIADNQTLRPKGFGFVTFLCEKDAKLAVESSAGLKVCNREVAIDFCMNKESFMKYGQPGAEETTEGETQPQEGEEVAKIDIENDDGKEDEDNEEGDDEENNSEEEEDADNEDGENSGDDEDEPEKKPSEDVQEGCTVFVRGLPFDAEASDVKNAMKSFGRIVMSIVVKDKLTGISKGSAFVKFSSPEEATACLTEAGYNNGLNIKDRLCKINLAVDRESAQKLKTEDRSGKDKRNLYLANEGLLTPKEGSKDSKLDMSDADKDKRQRAQNEKRKKLQNPLFFVSGNRLNIRNLGKNVTDHELKIACLKAVKAALDKNLVTTKDLEAHIAAQGAAADITNVIPPMNNKTCVKSAKVMLDLNRVRSGVPQSRGYGFVEFAHHAHALGCLRELNNNNKYSDIATANVGGVETSGGGKGKLIVEFSLENIQKVKILKEREVRQKKYKENKAAEVAAGNTSSASDVKDKTEDKKSAKKNNAKSEVKVTGNKRKHDSDNESDNEVDDSIDEKPIKSTKDAPTKKVKQQSNNNDEKKSENKPVKATKPKEVATESVEEVKSDVPQAEEEIKKAEKKLRQKKRKLEYKEARKAERSEKAAKKARKNEDKSSDKPNKDSSKNSKDNKKSDKIEGKDGEEVKKKPWGGHKRLRAMKKPQAAAAKKK